MGKGSYAKESAVCRNIYGTPVALFQVYTADSPALLIPPQWHLIHLFRIRNCKDPRGEERETDSIELLNMPHNEYQQLPQFMIYFFPYLMAYVLPVLSASLKAPSEVQLVYFCLSQSA